MKKLLCAALLLWGIGNLHAQKKTVEKTLTVTANQKVHLDLKFANSIQVSAWDKKEAYIKITYEINGGKLNEALVLTFKPSQDQLQVLADLDQELIKQGKPEDCPDKSSKSFGNYVNGKPTQLTCTNINYEIMLPRTANLTLETINGDIELRGFTGPIKAKSISGFVDMDWASQKGASVALKTITGEVYSDVDIAFDNKREKAPTVGYTLKGQVQEGGPLIQLETISSNVYFRRKK